jgi:hypothetical protein
MIAGVIASATVGFELGNSSIDYFNATGSLSLPGFQKTSMDSFMALAGVSW